MSFMEDAFMGRKRLLHPHHRVVGGDHLTGRAVFSKCDPTATPSGLRGDTLKKSHLTFLNFKI